jgi:hypothetical protein
MTSAPMLMTPRELLNQLKYSMPNSDFHAATDRMLEAARNLSWEAVQTDDEAQRTCLLNEARNMVVKAQRTARMALSIDHYEELIAERVRLEAGWGASDHFYGRFARRV